MSSLTPGELGNTTPKGEFFHPDVLTNMRVSIWRYKVRGDSKVKKEYGMQQNSPETLNRHFWQFPNPTSPCECSKELSGKGQTNQGPLSLNSQLQKDRGARPFSRDKGRSQHHGSRLRDCLEFGPSFVSYHLKGYSHSEGKMVILRG